MAKFNVNTKTKKQKIKDKILTLLNEGKTDWIKIRKIILTDSELNAFPSEFKRVEKELITENIINVNK